MSETPHKGLSQEQDLEAKRLYGRHRRNAEALGWAEETMDHGDEIREQIAEARASGTEEEIPYQDRVFANGETTQRAALKDAEMHHNATMWEARRHKEEHLEEYREQARMEAETDGVEINLEDEEANEEQSDLSEVWLPRAIRERLGENWREKLEENLQNYPEMSWEIPQEEIDEAKKILLMLPLIHRSFSDHFKPGPREEKSMYQGIATAEQLSNDTGSERDNTYALDEKLGLDKAIFMHWGSIFPEGKYRDTFLKGAQWAVMIDPRVLRDPRCVATPGDISEVINHETMMTGEIDHVGEALIKQEYLDKLVTGEGWLEIIARRIASWHRGEDQGHLGDSIDAWELGEIKFFGEISRERIMAVLDTKNFSESGMYADEISRTLGIEVEDPNFIERYLGLI